MNDYRERLETAGLLGAFEHARKAKDKAALKAICQQAGFNELEIESLVWSNGDIPEPPTPEEKRRNRLDDIAGRLGMAVVTGCVIGGLFAYASLGLNKHDTRSEKADKLMHDYRSPKEALLKPFLWGFGLGAVSGLVAGETVLLGLLEASWKNKNRR